MPPRPVDPPRKPDLYVVARFLDKLTRPGAVYTRSRLQAAVRLNYDLFRSYLALMTEKGFVAAKRSDDGKEVFQITPAGLEAYHHLVGWIRDVFGKVPR